jgi:hypothetical protein
MDAMEIHIYQYQPLTDSRDIHFLHVAPDNGDDEVSCTSSHVSLATAPKYETLSYTWGETDVTRQI